ncbi:hypothetical protein Pla175_12900 [Pirellulimonas nuda]|uniref:Uncharacterized protein n=1 Tax=Pirellulimonas nuda TaxID=2528009 RepID=A0A518D8X7_9BACT|nr:hypothetical protein [Pirellulimonas nuda]QDU87923.1 hypothetical protein Pla175_12900 [Pirellulimonas nuda]
MTALPTGVTRDRHAGGSIGLDNCHAVQIRLHDLPGRIGRCVVVWRDSPPLLRPGRRGQAIRELRRGDLVRLRGRIECVRELVLHR